MYENCTHVYKYSRVIILLYVGYFRACRLFYLENVYFVVASNIHIVVISMDLVVAPNIVPFLPCAGVRIKALIQKN